MMTDNPAGTREVRVSSNVPAPPSDATLFARVVSWRDKEAFTELYRRHHSDAYRFARALLPDEHLAAEAVQEALLDLWRSRKSELQQESLRPFVLRLVYQRAMNASRIARNQRRVPGHLATQTATAPVHPTEQGERLQVLSQVLSGLDKRDQAIIDLYYRLGLSQDQISKTLKMPQRTVSARIQGLLKSLRSQLSSRGLSEISLAGLESALGDPSLHPLPDLPLADPTVLQRLWDRASRPSAGRSAIGRSGLLATGLLALGVLGVYLAQPKGEVQPPPTAAAPIEKAILAQGAAPAGSYERIWHFDSPDDTALIRPVQGGWAHSPGDGLSQTGCRSLDDQTETVLEVDLPPLPLPLEVSFSVRRGQKRIPIRSVVEWRDLERWAFLDFRGTLLAENTWMRRVSILNELTIDSTFDGGARHLSVLRRKGAGPLRIELQGLERIDELRIRTIAAEAAPEQAPLLEALRAHPPSPQSPAVALPGLRSLRPPLPILATLPEGLRVRAQPAMKSWRFSSAPPEDDFLITTGSWRHLRTAESPSEGCMEIRGAPFRAVVNLIPSYGNGLVLTLRSRALQGPDGLASQAPFATWEANPWFLFTREHLLVAEKGWQTLRTFLMPEGWSETWTGGERLNLTQVSAVACSLPCITGKGPHQWAELEVRSPQPAEVAYMFKFLSLAKAALRANTAPKQLYLLLQQSLPQPPTSESSKRF